MAPVGFDDLAGVAADILDGDYQTNGYSFSSSKETSFHGATINTSFDLWPGKGVQTPSTLSWSIPKPFGIAGLNIGKFSLDKSGEFALSASIDDAIHNVKDLDVEVSTDLQSPDGVGLSLSYAGVADTLISCETPVTRFNELSVQATRAIGGATVGVACGLDNITAPDVGLNFTQGPLFCALLAKEKFGSLSAYAAYTVSDKLAVAATAEKDAGITLGAQYSLADATTVKAKIAALKDESFSCSVKHDIQKGFSMLAGAQYCLKTGATTYGASLNIE